MHVCMYVSKCVCMHVAKKVWNGRDNVLVYGQEKTKIHFKDAHSTSLTVSRFCGQNLYLTGVGGLFGNVNEAWPLL